MRFGLVAIILMCLDFKTLFLLHVHVLYIHVHTGSENKLLKVFPRRFISFHITECKYVKNNYLRLLALQVKCKWMTLTMNITSFVKKNVYETIISSICTFTIIGALYYNWQRTANLRNIHVFMMFLFVSLLTVKSSLSLVVKAVWAWFSNQACEA